MPYFKFEPDIHCEYGIAEYSRFPTAVSFLAGHAIAEPLPSPLVLSVSNPTDAPPRHLVGTMIPVASKHVELLAICCERASQVELERLEEACFALREAARWSQEGQEWAQQELALLRLAARAADRPGHLLLIHSLERSFWSMAEWVLPHLDSEAVQSWAQCALYALAERNAQELRRELPPLLHSCEARLLRSLQPASPPPDFDEAHAATAHPRRALGSSAPGGTGQPPPDAAAANLSGCRTGSPPAPPTGAAPSQSPSTDCYGPAREVHRADSPPGQEEDRGSPDASSATLGSSHSASAPGQHLPCGPPEGSESTVWGPALSARPIPVHGTTAPDNTG